MLGKRKRTDEDGHDDEDEDSLFIFDENNIPKGDTATFDDNDSELDESPLQPYTEVDSDDDMDEGAGTQARYDPANESYPRCAAYDKRLSKIAPEVIKLPRRIRDILKQHRCDSPQFRIHRDAAEKLLEIPPMKKFRIALLGNAGTGKSSVLNSLSDLGNLAKSSSIGSSVTCVPTEYSGAYPGQEKNCTAYIHYFDMKKIRSMLREQLQDYNVYQFERDQHWAPEIVAGYQLKNQNAFKTFRILFCDLREFENNDRARETLEKAYNRNDNGLLEMMVGSCEAKLKNKITNQAYFEWRAANTLEALRKKIDPLTLSERKFDQPALWPLMRQVCIFVRGPHILDDIIIVDLPGISDTNESRVNLTKEYIKSCDYVWIVSRIDRVVDDATVLRLLSTYGRVFKGNIAVICTRSDDNIANEQQQLAEDLQGRGQDMSRFQKLTVDLKTMETQIAQAKNRRRAAQALGVQAVTKNAEVVRLKAASLSLKSQRLASLIQARNAWVTEQLQEKAQHDLPAGGLLQVFCVSNSHYAVARGLVKREGVTLEAAATGIPALREFTLTLPATKLLRELTDHKSELLRYLKTLELWVNTPPIEPRGGLMQLVKRPDDELTKYMIPRNGEFERVLRDIITTPMCTLRHDATKAALEVTAEKSRNMHHSSILAFVRKRGSYATNVCPEQCWNEEFSEVSSDKAISAMPALEAKLLSADGTLEAKAHKDLRAVITEIRGQRYHASVPVETLNELVEGHVLGISNVFRDAAEARERRLRTILLDMTQDSNRNYFSLTMIPVYDSCTNDSGQGVTARSMTKIETHLKQVNERSPYTILARKATNAIRKVQEHHGARIEKGVRRIYSDFYTTVDRTVDRQIEDPTETLVIQDLRKELPAINAEYARLSKIFETIKREYAE